MLEGGLVLKKLETPTLEIVRFECNDVITTSGFDHDNGFIDGDTLVRAIKDLAEKIL